MVIIELFSVPTQFHLISVKHYYNLIIKTDKNFNKDIKNISLETYNHLEHQDVLSIYLRLNISPTLVPSAFLIFLTPTSIPASTFLILVKYGCRKLQKYLILGNFLMSSDIYYVMDNLYYDIINMRLLHILYQSKKNFWSYLRNRYFRMLTQKTCQLVNRFSTHNLMMKSKILILIRLLKNLV